MNLKAIPKRVSCSPTVITRGLGYLNGDDDVNPVLMGAKMVERVVNMRKLAPPNQHNIFNQNNASEKSQDNSGIGRLLSRNRSIWPLRHLAIIVNQGNLFILAMVLGNEILKWHLISLLTANQQLSGSSGVERKKEKCN
ncbi:hypothetical protein R6Q57_008195 [Mikania cordata]